MAVAEKDLVAQLWSPSITFDPDAKSVPVTVITAPAAAVPSIPVTAADGAEYVYVHSVRSPPSTDMYGRQTCCVAPVVTAMVSAPAAWAEVLHTIDVAVHDCTAHADPIATVVVASKPDPAMVTTCPPSVLPVLSLAPEKVAAVTPTLALDPRPSPLEATTSTAPAGTLATQQLATLLDT
jgi:hypothetical protein